MNKNKILFLTPYPYGTAASQRFRCEQYYDLLIDKGFEVEMKSFMSNQTWEILYSGGSRLKKISGIIAGFIRRILLLLSVKQFDFVFIHREASPIGPPIFEWFIAKIWKKNVIYDFDDAIWMNNTTIENRKVASIKWHSKVGSICNWAYRVSVGNGFLSEYALSFNENVVINPTTIDTDNLHIPNSSRNKTPIIGWTGTHSTLKYLKEIVEPLTILQTTHKFQFNVIADKRPEFEIPNMKFIPWSGESEIDDLNSIDIGVMPLEDNEWAKGKCGFKALQFMALEKAVLVSPVGVNKEIVEEGVSGFYCITVQEWVDKMKLLIEKPEIRQKMGQKGREKVIAEYSVRSNSDNFLRLFQ